MCSSRLCLRRVTGSVCAQPCSTGTDCTNGDVCGRFDYREPDPDSGLLTGPASEVVRVCRASLRVACSASAPSCTAPGERCVAAVGACARTCATSADCPTQLCVPDGCGQGFCAAFCDERAECADGWFCDLVPADNIGHGRCEPVAAVDAGVGDAAMCPATDAAVADGADP